MPFWSRLGSDDIINEDEMTIQYHTLTRIIIIIINVC